MVAVLLIPHHVCLFPCVQTFGIKGDLLGLLPGRQTYVFDASGKCVLSFNDQLNAEKHVEEALAALKNVKVAA